MVGVPLLKGLFAGIHRRLRLGAGWVLIEEG